MIHRLSLNYKGFFVFKGKNLVLKTFKVFFLIEFKIELNLM